MANTSFLSGMKSSTPLHVLVSMMCLAGWLAGAQPKVVVPTQPPITSNYMRILVTNWYAPEPDLRTVNGQIYNPQIGQLWKTLVIPAGAAIQGASYNGSVQPIDVTFVWGPQEGRDNQTVLVRNYPYNPRDFRHDRDNPYSEIVAARQLNLRAFPIEIQTNWSPLGRAWIGQRTYDYGVPYAGMVPVPTWKEVPAEEVPNLRRTSTAASSSPNDSSAMPSNAYLHGAFSNRLAAIQNFSANPMRDTYLLDLAMDAARQGDVTTVRQSIGGISNPTSRDGAAQLAATVLAQNGKAGDAYAIANMILNEQRHRMAIDQLNRQMRQPTGQ